MDRRILDHNIFELDPRIRPACSDQRARTRQTGDLDLRAPQLQTENGKILYDCSEQSTAHFGVLVPSDRDPVDRKKVSVII